MCATTSARALACGLAELVHCRQLRSLILAHETAQLLLISSKFAFALPRPELVPQCLVRYEAPLSIHTWWSQLTEKQQRTGVYCMLFSTGDPKKSCSMKLCYGVQVARPKNHTFTVEGQP